MSNHGDIFIKAEPTQKRLRMACILQSKKPHPCYFCGEPNTVRVSTTGSETYPAKTVEGESIYKEGFRLRHHCERHKNFGYWPGYDIAWGWE